MTILSRLQRLFPRRHPNGTAPDSDVAVTLLRAQYERMVEISADAIISVDERQRIILFNTGAEAIFGYRRDEVRGKPLQMLIPERFRQYHNAHMQVFAEGDGDARRMGDRLADPPPVREGGGGAGTSLL